MDPTCCAASADESLTTRPTPEVLATFATDRGGSMKRRAQAAPVRRQPRQRRAKETVEAVLDAVVHVLKKHGVDGVTTNRIAEAAGFVLPNMVEALSHGAAYRRPPGLSLAAAKDEAVRAVLSYLA
jgi:hypothetical protein